MGTLWREEVQGNYIDIVSQGLTIQLDISHHFLVENTIYLFFTSSMATAAFDHHPLPLLGFHTNDQDDFKSAPDA